MLIVAFVARASKNPTTSLVDIRIFRHVRLDAALAAYLLTAFGEFGAQLVLPLYYQQVRGLTAMTTGLLLAPQGVGMLISLPLAGRLTDRIENGKVVIGGVILTLLGTWAFATATDHSSYWLLSVSLVLRGAGLGATAAPAVSAAYKTLAPDEIPNGTTAINIVQRLGAPLGTAAMAITLHWLVTDANAKHGPLAAAFAHTFAVSAALSALAIFAGIVLAKSAPAPSPGPAVVAAPR